jgi:hypothetical protein
MAPNDERLRGLTCHKSLTLVQDVSFKMIRVIHSRSDGLVIFKVLGPERYQIQFHNSMSMKGNSHIQDETPKLFKEFVKGNETNPTSCMTCTFYSSYNKDP